MGRLGTLTLQALDESDIFLKEDVFNDGMIDYEESLCDIPSADPGFEYARAWETGKVPQEIPVIVDGDSAVIIGWFKTDYYSLPFTVRIYIVYEEPDKILDTGSEDDDGDEQEDM